MAKKINPLLIYILTVCAGLTLGNYAYNYFNLQKKSIAAKTKTSAEQPKTTIPAPLPVKPIPPAASITPDLPINSLSGSEPAFVLNGVFFEQGEGFALINNKIVRIGDEVDQGKVKEIKITGVELEFEGKTIKLLSPS